MRKPRIGFFLYDAGETGALLPVFELLTVRKIDYRIYAITTAAKILVDHPQRVAETNVHPLLKRPAESWPREEVYDEAVVQEVCNALDCDLFLTGMASKIQSQVLARLQSQKVPAWTIFESFSENYAHFTHAYFDAKPNLILTTSLPILDFFKSFRPGQSVELVGQPSLEKWIQSASQISRADVLKKSGVELRDRPLLIYAGGYGPDFPEGLRLFLDFSRRLIEDFEICVAAHPRSTRELEQESLKAFGLQDKIRLLPADMTTAEAIVAADIVMSHRSLVGMQALFIGKPTVYLDPFPARYKDLAIELGWSPQVQTFDQLKAALDRCLHQKPPPASSLFEAAGIPTNSAQRIADLIELKISMI